MTYVPPQFEYRRPADFGAHASHPVVIVGAGMVGLTLALDLARRGIAVVVVDEDDRVAEGSRAIVLAKRSLEIYGRLGLGDRLLDKGVGWRLARIYHHDRPLYEYDFLPEEGHRFPAFINVQQYYLEEWLVDACRETGLVDLRWRNRVVAVRNGPERATVEVETPDGVYALDAEWLIACDGAHSFVRQALDLPFAGRVFNDRFLIADVRMQAPFPTERRFWFDPPFHPGRSVLVHKQPDDVWRIDFQLGLDVDPEAERKPERVGARIAAMLGTDVDFELVWASVYTFRCRRIERFAHGRILFVGDSAHVVSPFGGRGGNGGVHDADNLAWKLAAVLDGRAPATLIETYDEERVLGADENIRHSSRSADFITPRCKADEVMREAILRLSEHMPFARRMVNSGRLSTPASLAGCAAIQPADEAGAGAPLVGRPAIDAPVVRDGAAGWLLPRLGGAGFTLLGFGRPDALPPAFRAFAPDGGPPVARVVVSPEPDPSQPDLAVLHDVRGLVAGRYGMPAGAVLLIRPDQHVAAAFDVFDAAAVERALARALGAGGTDAIRAGRAA